MKEEGERGEGKKEGGGTAKEEGGGRGGLPTSPPREPRGLSRWPARPAAVPSRPGPRTPSR